jgi:hypothetical protein
MQHTKDTKKHKNSFDGEKSRHIRNAKRSLSERKAAKQLDRIIHNKLGTPDLVEDDTWL